MEIIKQYTMDPERRYSVWVGGTEVNDYLLTLDDATMLAYEWSERGYDEVGITKYELNQ
tara:strand:+ start:564 stop:740 length:177 start_codon:yes stop_codon:yes gene_type:complete